MYPRKAIKPSLYIWCAMIGAAMASCGPRTEPEEAVRQWVEDAQAAVEAKERGVLERMIADSYADARGNDKPDIVQMLRVWFLQTHTVVLVSRTDEVTVMGDSAARVLLTAGMAGTSAGVFSLDADAMRFELELESTGDEWLLIGARWGRLGGELR